ncbi:MAG: hypothetical protein NPMRTH1_300004 [Nitrosopumilales archaeon]|nr:MAG: hypothetical protein NPMRTH1_300004 [Nitrosopumilales archaeon]
MSLIETVSDVNNTFLSRRELTCNFAGLGGKLKKLEAIEMISKEFKLDGKIVIPIRLDNHVGKPMITGTFYVYDDEELAKKHVNPAIFSRLDKAKKPTEENKEEKPAEEKAEVKSEDAKPEEDKKKKESAKQEKIKNSKEEKAEEKPKDVKTEDKKPDAKPEEEKDKEKSE